MRPDADQGHAEVAGRLAVVTGQDAEAAGIHAQRFVDAELHREVPDGARDRAQVLVEPARTRAIGVQGVDDALIGAAELGVAEQAVPVVRLHVDEELDGIVVAAPVVGVDPGEEARGLGRPAPPEVVGQVAQPLHLRRQLDVRDLEGRDVGAGADGLRVALRPAQGSR
jgi:hypothetical protein